MSGGLVVWFLIIAGFAAVPMHSEQACLAAVKNHLLLSTYCLNAMTGEIKTK